MAMSFEEWIASHLDAVSLKSSVKPSVRMTDASTISRWVTEDSFSVTIVTDDTKKMAADRSAAIRSSLEALADHAYILTVTINAATSDFSSGRWVYDTVVTIRHRRLDDWSDVE